MFTVTSHLRTEYMRGMTAISNYTCKIINFRRQRWRYIHVILGSPFDWRQKAQGKKTEVGEEGEKLFPPITNWLFTHQAWLSNPFGFRKFIVGVLVVFITEIFKVWLDLVEGELRYVWYKMGPRWKRRRSLWTTLHWGRTYRNRWQKFFCLFLLWLLHTF